MAPIHTEHPGTPTQPDKANALWRIVVRYGPQDLAAALGLLLVGQALGHLPGPQLAAIASLTEMVCFYGVTLIRRRSEPHRISLLAEYGPSELTDLLSRPLMMSLCVALLPGFPTVALFLGSSAADALFYSIAARQHARRARPGRASSPQAGASSS